MFTVYYTRTLIRFLDQACRTNEWCSTPQTGSNPFKFLSAKYMFINLRWHMTWFEALDECRYQGEGSELLVIESPSEGEWILQMISKINYTDDPNDRVWHVNAHRHLYNSEYSAWANGRSLGIPTVRTTQSWNCTAGGVLPRAVENECLGLDVKENADLILVYLNCTSKYTSRAICKRPNLPMERSNTVSAVFNPAEWVPSPRNESLFYSRAVVVYIRIVYFRISYIVIVYTRYIYENKTKYTNTYTTTCSITFLILLL